MILPRFYPILDTRVARARGLDPLAAAAAILGAGAGMLQFRHKDTYDAAAFALAERIAALCREHRAIFVVNDRADVAKMLDAAVHVGQEDLAPTDARTVVGDLPIGYSTHNEAQFQAGLEEPADYLALGPIFGTVSKDNPDPVVGTAELERLRALSDRPVVAIGGITRSTARQVLDAGADSIAVIGDLFPPEGGMDALRRSAAEWVRAAS